MAPPDLRDVLGLGVGLALALLGCTDEGTRRGDGGAAPSDAAPGDAGLAEFLPAPPANPFAARDGFATQHGDTAASDTTPLPGPGSDAVDVSTIDLLAACPSLLPTRGGQLLAVCTKLASRAPAVFLLDGASGATLDTLELAPGQLFGGVYPYLDHEDRLRIVDGNHDLLRVGVEAGEGGGPRLAVEERLPLAGAIAADCGSPPCDGVVGLAPDHEGRIWFATDLGTVGAVDPSSGRVATLALPGGERVGNSLATAREGTAVVTDHALYLLRADAAGAPVIVFRAEYDRGPARKPGQLTHGSGATPTFFGPSTGSEYLAITDNARPVMNLLVFRADASAELICKQAIPAPAGLGSENSPIGAGRSVILASTYGYPYPALPGGSLPSDPETAPLLGGMARVDVAEGALGCGIAWTLALRSAAVPKLSLADRLVYTVERTPPAGDGGAPAPDGHALAVIDPDSGEVRARHPLPGVSDTLQLAGTVAPGRVFLQGTLTGLIRVAVRAAPKAASR